MKENVLQIQQMIDGLDPERTADLLMQQNPNLDPTEMEGPALPQKSPFDMFASAIGTPESGLKTPAGQLPAPHLFGFGNPAQPRVTVPGTGAPQTPFPSLFGGK